MLVYEYVMTYDTGFAPNPFYGVCTLACCKPKIRKEIKNYLYWKVKERLKDNLKNELNKKSVRIKKEIVDKKWEGFLNDNPDVLSELGCVSKEEFILKQNIFVIGLAGKSLQEKLGNDSGANYPIVYIMRVTDILTFDQYYTDQRYEKKIPTPSSVVNLDNNADITCCGDNIYKNVNPDKMDKPGELAVRTAFHGEEELKNDLSGECVLISGPGNYVYYGRQADGKTDIGETYKYVGHKKFYFGDDANDNSKLRQFLGGFDALENKGIIAPPINSKINMEDII